MSEQTPPPIDTDATPEPRHCRWYEDVGEPLTPEEIAALTPDDIEHVSESEIVAFDDGTFLRVRSIPARHVSVTDPETGESHTVTVPGDPAEMSIEDAQRSAAAFVATTMRRAETLVTDEQVATYAATLEQDDYFRALADTVTKAARETFAVSLTESEGGVDIGLAMPPEHYETAAKEATKHLHTIITKTFEGLVLSKEDDSFRQAFARDVLRTAWAWALEDANAGIEGLRETGELTPEASTPQARDELARALFESGTYMTRALFTINDSTLTGLVLMAAEYYEAMQRETPETLREIVSRAWKRYTESLPQPAMMPGFRSGWGTIPNSRAARSSILAIQGGADGKWQAHPTTGYPWFAAPELNFQVSLDDYQTADAAWEAVRRLDDETADTFMIACAQYSANRDHTPDGLVLITPDEVLAQRGKAKHKRAYKTEDREKAAQDFMRLGTITVEGHRDRWESTGRKGKGKGKRVRVTLEGRLIEISVKARRQTLSGELAPMPGTGKTAGFWYRLGPWAQGFLGTDGSAQLAEMNQTIIQYHAQKQRYQKRIGRYLVWIFRNQRGGKDFQLRTLLAQSGIELAPSDYKNPGRFRDAIDRALEELLSDGVIGSLEWMDTPVLPTLKWLDEWLCHTVRIDPPKELLERYERIGKPRLQVLPDTKESA